MSDLFANFIQESANEFNQVPTKVTPNNGSPGFSDRFAREDHEHQLISDSIFPIGSMIMFAGATAPSGYFICDGAAISRSTYSQLFTVLGTSWGAGNGSTTFNLPDLRGRTPIGAGTGSGLTARTLGVSLGEENHLLALGESGLYPHNHTATFNGDHAHNGSTNNPGDHNHQIGAHPSNNMAGQDFSGTEINANISVGGGSYNLHGLNSSGNHTHTVSTGGMVSNSHSITVNLTGPGGADSAHNNMQPSAVVNYIIRGS